MSNIKNTDQANAETVDQLELVAAIIMKSPSHLGTREDAYILARDVLQHGIGRNGPSQPTRDALLDALEDLMCQADEDCPLERRSGHLSNALTQAMLLLEMSKEVA